MSHKHNRKNRKNQVIDRRVARLSPDDYLTLAIQAENEMHDLNTAFVHEGIFEKRVALYQSTIESALIMLEYLQAAQQ